MASWDEYSYPFIFIEYVMQVSDNGDSPLSTVCHLIVELVDVNENRYAPRFEDTVLEASVYGELMSFSV